ncbi:wiskott-Aldrich syndrome protein family member 3-like isoform X1 [Acanthaster planci]|uniref:Wiskott-Aldrich syndrome protein family member n=2 Tax=Acanthaster planci TaxID=133434 RepID=A0A8B7XLU9_ACAPL|nr:wiskott-Aldrich syndrome protein family member 3-like isoform X1 [Acanthaster planci]
MTAIFGRETMATGWRSSEYQFAGLRRPPNDPRTRSLIPVAMPLVKREIEPVHLSRGVISQGISNELECVTNTTLAGIIKQLSNLSKHAEDIFGDLYNEAHSLCRRSNSLQDRIDRLSVKVKQLDATRDDVSLQDIQMRKAFKSSTLLDQEVVANYTMPSAMRETYMRCDKPPKLNLLTPYREDGKEALKFYTDPKYFFQLWCEEMQKNITDIREKKNRKRKRHDRKTKAGGSKPSEVRTRKKEWQAMAGGKEFMPDKTPSITPTSETREQPNSDWGSTKGSNQNIDQYQQQQPPMSQPQPAPPHQLQHQEVKQQGMMSRSSSEGFDDVASFGSGGNQRDSLRPKSRPPPPPSNQTTPEGVPPPPPVVNGTVHVPKRPAPVAPPPQQQQQHNHHLPPQQHQQFAPQHTSQTIIPPPPPIDNRMPMMNNIANHAPPEPALPPPQPIMNSNIPAPPPPPPPPPLPVAPGMAIPPPPKGPAPAPTSISPPSPPQGGEVPETSSPGNPTSPRRTSMRPGPKVDDSRNNLLTAIQRGINLRKVEIQEERARHQTPVPNSVEAILARRIAVELSDTESDDDEDEDDDEEWDD